MDIATRNKTYNRAGHLVYSCQYHVIFCPKYRRKVLKAPYDEALKNMFYEIAEKYNFSIPDLEIMPDHVHMVIDCDPRFGIAECVKKLKGETAHRLRSGFPELKSRLPNLWTRSTFISSVGCVSLEVVQQYIADQKYK